MKSRRWSQGIVCYDIINVTMCDIHVWTDVAINKQNKPNNKINKQTKNTDFPS